MVPDHNWRGFGPKSGESRGTRASRRKNISFAARIDAQNDHNRISRGITLDEMQIRLWQRCVPFVVEQMRQELAHIAWRIEVPGNAARATADGECNAIEI